MLSQSRSGIRIVSNFGLFLVWTALFCFLAIGCGGGGGGTDGPDAPDGPGGPGGGDLKPVTYNGISTPAVITEDNANTIAANAMESNTGTNGFNVRASMEGGAQDVISPLMPAMAQAINDSLEQIDFDHAADLPVRAASRADSGTQSGSCGGNMVYNMHADASGGYSGTITYNAYCEGGMTLSGVVSYKGANSTETGRMESLMVFDSYTVSTASASHTMNGQVLSVVNGDAFQMDMDVDIRDNNIDYVWRVEDYQVNMNLNSSRITMNITGRFYDPDYGYIDLSTPSDFQIDSPNVYPHTGTMEMVGESGPAGGATMVRITAVSATECHVQADTTGDGTLDYDTGVILWEDLCSDD